MIVLSSNVIKPMSNTPINGFNPIHRNGDEMGMVYGIGRILRYIGLIWFDEV